MDVNDADINSGGNVDVDVNADLIVNPQTEDMNVGVDDEATQTQSADAAASIHSNQAGNTEKNVETQTDPKVPTNLEVPIVSNPIENADTNPTSNGIPEIIDPDLFISKKELQDLLDSLKPEIANQIECTFSTLDSKSFKQSYPFYYDSRSIKKSLTKIFRLSVDCIALNYRSDDFADEKRLIKCKANERGINEFQVRTTDAKYKLRPEEIFQDAFLLTNYILNVKVEKEDEVFDVLVQVKNDAIEKPQIGGYRNIQSGVKYHHGYTQTGPPRPKVPPEMKNHRDTQTYFTRNRRTEREYPRATQTHNKSLYMPSVCDKIITAGPYETADEREARLDVEGKVRLIQKNYRIWKMKKCLKELSAEYKKRVRLAMERDQREKQDDEARRKKDIISKAFPVSSYDFSMIYSMIDRWKKTEIKRINSELCGAAKIAELYMLLEKEIELLRAVDRLRKNVYTDLETKRIEKFFREIGTPIQWNSDYKGLLCVMDSLETQKGRVFYEVYKALTDDNIFKDKEKFNQVYKDTIEFFKNRKDPESGNIVALAEKIYVFSKAPVIKINLLKKIHERLKAKIVNYFKIPHRNDGVTNYMLKAKMKKNRECLKFCKRCEKLKTKDAYPLHARVDKLTTCTACKWLEKSEEPWIDFSPYRFILKHIRTYERLHQGISSTVYILQDRDIHFIMNSIWHGHSAISECTDIYRLRLVRWKKEDEWSPWNCILLTLEESKDHLRIENLQDVYDEEFISHVTNKHSLAKTRFSNLMGYDKYFRVRTKDDPRLDDNSDYYKSNKPVCLGDDY